MVEPLTRRDFLKAVAALGLLPLGCAPKNDSTSHSPQASGKPGSETSPDPNAEWYQRADILSMGLALGIENPNVTAQVADIFYAQGFKIREQTSLALPGEESSSWFKVKNPSGGWQTEVYYHPQRQEWLKVLRSNHEGSFARSIEAVRTSVEIAGLDSNTVTETTVKIGDQSFKAMRTRHFGASLKILLQSRTIDLQTAARLYQTSYANALKLAARGFLFDDPSFNNVIVEIDGSGKPTGKVVNIDFTNRRLVVNSDSPPVTRAHLINRYTRQAKLYSLEFDAQTAEKTLDEAFRGKFRQPLRNGQSVQVLTSRDNPFLPKNAVEVPVEEIHTVDSSRSTLAVKNADGRVVTAEVSPTATRLRSIDILRNPAVKNTGRTLLKIIEGIGLVILADELVERLYPPYWDTFTISVDKRADLTPFALTAPVIIYERIMKYKNSYNSKTLPGYQEFENRQQAVLYEMASLGFKAEEYLPQYWETLKEETSRFANGHLLAERLHLQTSLLEKHVTDINLSAQLLPDGRKRIIIWRDISPETQPPDQEEDPILFILESTNETEIGTWKVLAQGNNTRVGFLVPTNIEARFDFKNGFIELSISPSSSK